MKWKTMTTCKVGSKILSFEPLDQDWTLEQSKENSSFLYFDVNNNSIVLKDLKTEGLSKISHLSWCQGTYLQKGEKANLCDEEYLYNYISNYINNCIMALEIEYYWCIGQKSSVQMWATSSHQNNPLANTVKSTPLHLLGSSPKGEEVFKFNRVSLDQMALQTKMLPSFVVWLSVVKSVLLYCSRLESVNLVDTQ